MAGMGRRKGNGRKRGPMGAPRYKPVDEQLWAAYPALRSKLKGPVAKGRRRIGAATKE